MNTKTISPTEVQKYLSGIDYPCSKQDLIKHAKGKNAPGEIVGALNGLPDREYMDTPDVTSELWE